MTSAVGASDQGRAAPDEVTLHLLAAFSAGALDLDETAYERRNGDRHTMLAALAP